MDNRQEGTNYFLSFKLNSCFVANGFKIASRKLGRGDNAFLEMQAPALRNTDFLDRFFFSHTEHNAVCSLAHLLFSQHLLVSSS